MKSGKILGWVVKVNKFRNKLLNTLYSNRLR